MATKREYLTSLDLAKPGRGKFSAKAEAAAAEYLANGGTFDVPVKPAPKPKADKPAAAAPKPKPVSLVKVPKPGPTVQRVVAPIVDTRVRVRPENVLYAVTPIGPNKTARVQYEKCWNTNCRQPVKFCTCKEGPLPPMGATRVVGYPTV